MLISYQKDGDFEFRFMSKTYIFYGQIGNIIQKYLKYLYDVLALKETTISNKRFYLWRLNSYLEERQFGFENLTPETIMDFLETQNFTLSMIYNCSTTLKLFLQHAFDSGITASDYSINIPSSNYKNHSKLPSTYEEDEIKRILSSIDRNSLIGKRDFLIILLAAEYGWRASDIVNFKFEHVDWDKNEISFQQKKTDNPVVYPLLSSIGNAIIDYLKDGRPETTSNEIIVSAESSKRGQKMCAPTIHSIVTKYMRTAKIKDWQIKKHGSHSLRFSLATNMLKRNVAMPIISTVLGHKSTESTKTYLSVDIESLKKCPLPVPSLKSEFYEVMV